MDVTDGIDYLVTTPRIGVSIEATGSFTPGEPLTLRIVATASVEATSASVRVVLPEVEAAKLSEFGDEFEVPTGRSLPPLAQLELRTLGETQSIDRTFTVTIPAPGYYRVSVMTDGSGPIKEPAGLFTDSYEESVWLLITEDGGEVTAFFDPDKVPEGYEQSPGPLRNFREQRLEPASASLFSSVASLLKPLFFRTTTTVYVKYWNPPTSSYLNAADATVFVSAYLVGQMFDYPTSGGVYEVAGSDGYVTYDCESGKYYYASANLNHSEMSSGDLGAGWAPSCGGTYTIYLPDGYYEAFQTYKEVIPDVDNALGYSRSKVQYRVSTYGCGTSSQDERSCYSPSTDRITLRTVSARATGWVMAHEYGHALHEESLNGLWGASCPSPHYINVASGYACALQEGFADYVGDVGGQTQLGWSGGWESFHVASSGSDYASEVEGNIAALFHDLIDINNESGDLTTYSAYYVATVFKTCETRYLSTWYDRFAVDQIVWCLENTIGGYTHTYNFPGQLNWAAQAESASEPGGWNACNIRSTWLKNVGIDGGSLECDGGGGSTPSIASCNIWIDEESESASLLMTTGGGTESVQVMRRINFGAQVSHELINTDPSTGGYQSDYYGSYGQFVEMTVIPFSGDDQTGTQGTSCSDASGIE